MTNTKIKSYAKRGKVTGKQKVNAQENKDDACCCEYIDIESNKPAQVICPTIEDFTNIIEESNILENRNLSLQLILMIDVFIGIHLYKTSENNGKLAK